MENENGNQGYIGMITKVVLLVIEVVSPLVNIIWGIWESYYGIGPFRILSF